MKSVHTKEPALRNAADCWTDRERLCSCADVVSAHSLQSNLSFAALSSAAVYMLLRMQPDGFPGFLTAFSRICMAALR